MIHISVAMHDLSRSMTKMEKKKLGSLQVAMLPSVL